MSDQANGQNGAASTTLVRSEAPIPLAQRDPPSLGKVMRWLQSHDDEGRLKCAYVQLTYQTAEHAAEEKPPSLLDIWTIDEGLAGDARRAAYRELAEKCWNAATEHMASAKVAHVWKVIRRNSADQHAGQMIFRLDANADSAIDTVGADPPNERGERAAVIRAFNAGTQMVLAHQLSINRLQLERELMDRRDMADMRTTVRETLRDFMQSIREREELLDRKAERDVRVAAAHLDLSMKADMYKMIGEGVKLFMMKHAPVPVHIQNFVGSLRREQLEKIFTDVLEPEQQQVFAKMLAAFAEAEAREQKLREEAQKKAAEKGEKEGGSK